jgi:predicted RNA-binding Zn ribbon-like protein
MTNLSLCIDKDVRRFPLDAIDGCVILFDIKNKSRSRTHSAHQVCRNVKKRSNCETYRSIEQFLTSQTVSKLRIL